MWRTYVYLVYFPNSTRLLLVIYGQRSSLYNFMLLVHSSKRALFLQPLFQIHNENIIRHIALTT